MVLHMNALCSTRTFLDVFTPSSFNARMVLFLAIFLVCEVSISVEGMSLSTKIHRNVTVLSKTGKYLTIGHNGVTGKGFYSPHGKLQIHTAGFQGQIKIKGVLTGKYLVMSSTGKVSLVSNTASAEAFYDLRNIDGYISYRSTTYSTKYLIISGTGVVSGSTSSNTDDCKFAVFPAF